jgi:hypothetical protein
MDSYNSPLVSIRGQLDSIRSEVSGVTSGLQGIASLIQTDSALESQRLRLERDQEKKLVERVLRVGQEEQLQQTVSAALVEPIKKIEPKLNSTFDRATGALKKLFGTGFGILGISALTKGTAANLRKLTDIRGIFKSSLGFITSSFSLMRGGFTRVVNSIRGVTSKVFDIATDLAKSPLKAVSDLFKNFLKVKPGAGSAAAGAGAAAAGGFNILSLLGKGVTALGGAADVATGQNFDATLAFTSLLIPQTRLITGAAYATDAIAEMFGGNIFGKNPNQKPGASAAQSPMIPNFEFGENINFSSLQAFASDKINQFGNMFGFSGSPGPQPGSPQILSEDTTNTPGPKSIPVVPYKPPAQIQPAQTQTPNVGPSPEPKPDIIYTTTGNQEQGAVQDQQSGPITDVPLISSSNPDNFYTLYSQLNYNVVM